MLFKDEVNRVLHKDRWEKVHQRLLAKMLSEYMYEDIIKPSLIEEKNGISRYELQTSEDKAYRFSAKRRMFDSYEALADSIEVQRSGYWTSDVSAIEFLLDIQPHIPMSPETAGHLIKEFNHTMLADAHLLAKDALSADELTEADYAVIEGEMTGHPWIVYNKGRIGFGYDDYLRFAPENRKAVQLLWIAVHKKTATFHSVDGLDYETLINGELDEVSLKQFAKKIEKQGAEPKDYYLLPVHEWQWTNAIILQFPEEIASGAIIPLGEGKDQYLPQQSIRTFTNITHKHKHHIKLPMSILNTLVYRGLPSERTVIAPKITEHIKGIAEHDPFLREECRVILPGENASLNVNHPYYHSLEKAPYQYLEMLGAIFRESIYTYLEEGEHPVTLASLTYADQNGVPFIKCLIEKSGLSADEWIGQLFQTMMPPLLHFMYRYGTVFSPHGQNTILVLKGYKPHRLAIKDFVDDVNISDQPLPELAGLTDDLKAVLRSEPPEGLVQFIFTGLFICHLRYVANILDNHDLLPEKRLWKALADAILDYQRKFPELRERFELFDLFKPKLTKLCLNRNRMVDYGYRDGDDRPHASEFGKVTNALTQFKKEAAQL
ncbi:IucA/IucC family protein [Bacillus sp. JJ675]|uniref:IucA/IucC family protein n=1 Tax=Bacillus sp. JJ675 TaxID=3122972 RepID=UPI002FFEB74D